VATTSLWRITSRVDKVITYVKNPDKTTGIIQAEMQIASSDERLTENEQWLSNAIGYAMQDYKTSIGNLDEDVIIHDESIEVVHSFVSGLGCTPETAYDEMMAVKKQFGKMGGTVAYHGYQSFAEGEVTPELAHEIGVKLAETLWGERHQVVVTTHLDKETHIHNHFVLNTVSFVDGLKFYRSDTDYWDMRRESDRLCRKYGLSVVKTEYGSSKHYTEWTAENNGKPTWRQLVRDDVDKAIRQSITERQFFENLREAGYAIKIGKDITVRPPGKERGIKLRRNLGENYTIEAIRQRILEQFSAERNIIPAEPKPRQAQFKGNLYNTKRMTGLRARYFYYLYRMGAVPKRRTPNPRRVYFLFREDIRYMQKIAKSTRLLVANGIETGEQLAGYKASKTKQLIQVYSWRKKMRKDVRDLKAEIKALEDSGKLEENKTDCENLNKRIDSLTEEIATATIQAKVLRQEVNLCEDIEQRSIIMREKIRKAQEDENLKTKQPQTRQREELTKNERIK